MGDEFPTQEFVLKEDCELRFQVGSKSNCDGYLELLEGSAEVFGTQLDTLKKLTFPPGSRVAVFSWKGAKLEVSGDIQAYVAEHTPMVIYLNTHAALEQLRQEREVEIQQKSGDPNFQSKGGPRIMIVGPTDVGKSTVCRILCNYAVRQGRSPIFVDLDVGQGSVSVPGSIGALFINQMADIVDGFDRSKALVYNFGHLSPAANQKLYDVLIKELAETVADRCKTNPDAFIGGLIINTCGWVNGDGYQCLITAAEQFEADAIVVIDHERLYNELQKDLPSFVKIVHQPKSGGVEARSRELRINSRNAAIHRYFYGTGMTKYFPHTFDVSFDDIILCKIGSEKLPDSCLPFGRKDDDPDTKVVAIQIEPSMTSHMFAVSPCPTVSQAVVKANVMGFVVFNKINVEDRLVEILCPQKSLASKVLVWMDVSFSDIPMNYAS